MLIIQLAWQSETTCDEKSGHISFDWKVVSSGFCGRIEKAGLKRVILLICPSKVIITVINLITYGK